VFLGSNMSLLLYLFVFVFRLSTATLSGVEYHFIMQRYYWSNRYYWKYLGCFSLQIVIIVIGAWIKCIKVIKVIKSSGTCSCSKSQWHCPLEKNASPQDSSKGFRRASLSTI